ncbi:extracellular solute-binding protein [uncultured Ruminococcus sp.]|uniref:extracellular solute-binding protein n=1 Tax=uncultured Ruminococcus sp. TaxID=165186 RepID=UPI0025F59E6E|nr:extracellular solute-binding protein [uncultured Ruminococcus sp.]
MKEKVISILALAAVLSTSMLSSCGFEKDYDSVLNKDDPTTITIWHYYNGVQLMSFDEAVEEFNNTVGLEKGIIVEAYSKNSVSELADSVVASVKKDSGADVPPDIFATYAETAYVVDQLDGLADMSKYFTEDELNEYIDEYIAEGEFSGDGSLKIFPMAKSTEVMMLNYTDWEKFAGETGVTTDDLKTWEGLVDVSEKYYNYTDDLTPDIPNDGKAFFGRDSIANYMSIGAKQLGSEFVTVDKDGNTKLNIEKDALRRLWDNYYVPYVKGYFTAQGRFRSEDAKIGIIMALVCSTTGAMYFPTEVTIDDDYTYPIDNLVLPVPNFEGTDPYIVQQGAGMSVLKSDEKSEYASAVFLKWFTEKERNVNFSSESGYLPVKKDACNFEEIEKVSAESGKELTDICKSTLSTAIDEINEYNLYTMPPFKNSADVRTFLENRIQDTAQEAYAEATEKISSGESRDTVIEEYTNDAAFDKWYDSFCTDLDKIIEK